MSRKLLLIWEVMPLCGSVRRRRSVAKAKERQRQGYGAMNQQKRKGVVDYMYLSNIINSPNFHVY